MSDLIVGLAMVFVIEGMLYALFPARMRIMVQQMVNMPDSMLRNVGLASLGVGVFVVWLVRG